MSTSFLYDPLGPSGKKRARYIGLGANAVGLVLIALIAVQLGTRGQLDPQKWAILVDPATGVPGALWRGYVSTLQAAGIAMVLSLFVGLILAAGRLSRFRLVRLITGTIVEGLRGIPLLLLMLFSSLALPQIGIELSLLTIVVASLVAYNSSVLCEIFRGGILSIDRGQREAAEALGFSGATIMLKILLPQAVPRMLPVIISQMVILLKDTSIGFIIGYVELLRSGRSLVEYYGAQYSLQLYLAVAVMYIATNFIISTIGNFVASRQEKRSQKRPASNGAVTATSLIDIASTASKHG